VARDLTATETPRLSGTESWGVERAVMALKSSHELTRQAIERVLQKSIDAHTVEDALRCNSEILDLLATEIMIIRASCRSAENKENLLRKATIQAEYHRDIVDRLTDVVEQNDLLVLQWN
jgi:hypothetical protein